MEFDTFNELGFMLRYFFCSQKTLQVLQIIVLIRYENVKNLNVYLPALKWYILIEN